MSESDESVNTRRRVITSMFMTVMKRAAMIQEWIQKFVRIWVVHALESQVA